MTEQQKIDNVQGLPQEQTAQEYVTLTQEMATKRELAQVQFSLSPIGQMVKKFETLQRMAQMFAKSQIVPKAYQNNVADCTIALDMASKMDCSPLTVMQNLVIVQGRPTWQAQFLIACINKCGRFTTLQYKQWTDGMVGDVEYEDNEWDPEQRRNRLVKKTFKGANMPNYCCAAYASDLQTGEVVTGATISMKMAVAERWVTKSGSKWLTMPQQMLIYRAASFFQRAYCPEIGMGFHTTEEIQDAVVVDETGAAVAAPAPKAQTRRSALTDVAASAAMAMAAGGNDLKAEGIAEDAAAPADYLAPAAANTTAAASGAAANANAAATAASTTNGRRTLL